MGNVRRFFAKSVEGSVLFSAHQRMVQFEPCVADPLQRKFTAMWQQSKWSVLLLRIVKVDPQLSVMDGVRVAHRVYVKSAKSSIPEAKDGVRTEVLVLSLWDFREWDLQGVLSWSP